MSLGIFKSMPASDYHARRDFIGSSSLVEMAKSPRHFFHSWKGPAIEPTAAMQKGELIHSLLLEQDISRFVRRPLNEKGELIRSNSKEYGAFLQANIGKTPVHPDDFDPMYEMLTAFCENERAMAMMNGAEIEASIFAKDPETGIMLKARPDIWGDGYLVDLKSTSDIQKFNDQVFRMKYDVRLAHYARAIEAAGGKKIKNIFFIAYESSAPFCSKVFQLKTADIREADDQWLALANQVAVCEREGEWPGYSDEIQIAERPPFLSVDSISFDEVG